MDFSGQVAIITGGASGIGRATARALAKQGAAVAIADRDSETTATVVRELSGKGSEAKSILVDVADEASVGRMVAEVLAWKGQIDILIHSAGIGVERAFLETSLDDWNRVIGIDLTGTFLCGRAAAKEMVRRRYGRVVNLASTAGVRGGTGRAAYGAAKGGVIALTKVMAVELATSGVTVNALAPGAIETELVKKMHSATTRKVYTRAIPMDRYGTPDETAAAAVFLASREAGYITGHVLDVDGGFLAAGVLHKD